jgi:hypothetical protein
VRLPRFVHRLYAGLMGYYWKPCHLCGRMYGGHEASESVSVQVEGEQPNQKMVCSRHRAPFPMAHVTYHEIQL